jgi:hypothetical protein
MCPGINRYESYGPVPKVEPMPIVECPGGPWRVGNWESAMGATDPLSVTAALFLMVGYSPHGGLALWRRRACVAGSVSASAITSFVSVEAFSG